MTDEPFVLKTTCPYCDQANHLHGVVDGEDGPEPGNLSICWTCGGPAIFDDDLSLRQATDEELADPWVTEQVRKFNWTKRESRRRYGPF